MPSGGTLICYEDTRIHFNYNGTRSEIPNLQLKMPQSSVYAINKIDNSIDDGSLWNKKMSQFNNSRAFNFI